MVRGTAILKRIMFASLLVILAMTPTATAKPGRAADQTPPARPGAAELDRLKFYLGEWQYSEEYPNGARNTGVYTSKLGPGGNSLVNTFHSQGPVGDFEGMLVMTWDPKEKTYKAYAFGNDSPGAIVQTGGFEGESLVFRTQVAVGPQTLTMRTVARLTAADTLESDAFSSMNNGPERLLVHVKATRKR